MNKGLTPEKRPRGRPPKSTQIEIGTTKLTTKSHPSSKTTLSTPNTRTPTPTSTNLITPKTQKISKNIGTQSILTSPVSRASTKSPIDTNTKVGATIESSSNSTTTSQPTASVATQKSLSPPTKKNIALKTPTIASDAPIQSDSITTDLAFDQASPQVLSSSSSKHSTKSISTLTKTKKSTSVRLHSVENVISTPYIAPNGPVIAGATVKLNLKPKFQHSEDSVHAIFVTQNVFGNETDPSTNEDEDISNDEEDGTPNGTPQAKNFQMDFKQLNKQYQHVLWKSQKPLFRAQGFSAAAGSVANIVSAQGVPLLVVGLGKLLVNGETEAISASTFRTAIANATKAARKLKLPHLQLKLPDVSVLHVDPRTPTGFGNGVKGIKQQQTILMDDGVKLTQSIREVITNNYSFDKYLKQTTVQSAKHFKLNTISIIDSEHKFTPNVAHEAVHRAESENFAKEIGSLRSNLATSTYMKDQCEALVKAHPDVLKIKVLNKEELEQEGYNLLLAVNKGSTLPPYLVSIEYTPPKATPEIISEKPIVYIGKTLTFDTGGYNLKPSGSMETMYADKHGGCNTLALLRTLALARPQTSRRIVGVLTITDNQIGPNAIHPSDMFETSKGTVSVMNTDAEGRLALSSAIEFAQKEFNPARITTMATLTGAILVALGHNTGLFTNHRKLARELMESADKQGETFWNMPILKSNHTQLEGKECDINNISKGRNMGSSTAAAFLETFVNKDVSFVHLDIAGASTDSNDAATGATIPSLQDVILNH